MSLFKKPVIDLFASRLNNQVPQYVSWHPDPGASYIDAFTVDWHTLFFYAFPPFSLITRCLQMVIADEAEGILITPVWPSTQIWFTQLVQLSQDEPVLLPQSQTLLTLPTDRDRIHPLEFGNHSNWWHGEYPDAHLQPRILRNGH